MEINLDEQNLSGEENTDSAASDTKEETSTIKTTNAEAYEGGSLGTAGSGGMAIESTASSKEEAPAESSSDKLVDEISDNDKVPVPIIQDDYEGGNMGTAGSGSMEMHGSESSLTKDALTNKSTKTESNNQ